MNKSPEEEMEIRNIIRGENGSSSFELIVSAEEFAPYIKQAQKEKPNAFITEVHKTACRAALPGMFEKACIEQGFVPVSQPEFNVEACGIAGVTCVCSFIDYPQITRLEWKGLSAQKPVKLCSEADVSEAVDKYMRNHPYSRPADRPAQKGDIVEVSFSGTSGGKGFHYDHSDNAKFQVGAGTLFYGLDDAIVGHSAGDEFELTLTMPDNFMREKVRGLTIDLKVRVKTVFSRDILECTDEYVQRIIDGCNSLADFRELNRKKVQARYDQQSSQIYDSNLQAALAAAVTCPIPAVMVDVATEPFVTALNVAAMRKNLSVEEHLADIGKTMEQYMAACRPKAEENVRLSLALDHIIQTENIQLSREEFDEYVMGYAAKQRMTTEDAVKRLGGESAIIEQLLSNKAMRLVHRHSQPVEVVVEEFPTR